MPIIILMFNKLRACTCLSNMYTTRTRVVTPYKFTKRAKKILISEKNVQKACTRCVRLVYVLDKHVHAPKPSDRQFVIPLKIPPCTCLAFNSKKKYTCNLHITI